MFKDFRYRTRKSWSCERRVVGKAEYLAKGENPRFIVTSIASEEKDARTLYEDFYCARGDMENRIKEQQLGLFADRTSTAWMRSNQLRLYFSSFAYILMQTLRRLGLQGTELAQAQCDTIRLKLFKIGAQIEVTVRKVWISFSESCDLNRLKGTKDAESFAATLDEMMANELTNDFWSVTLPANLDSSSARNPELFAYVAAQNRLAAPVLFSHKKVQDLLDPAIKTKKKALERHHLFPRAWLERQGIDDLKKINQLANFALLEWPENIDISDTPPAEYVPEIQPRFPL